MTFQDKLPTLSKEKLAKLGAFIDSLTDDEPAVDAAPEPVQNERRHGRRHGQPAQPTQNRPAKLPRNKKDIILDDDDEPAQKSSKNNFSGKGMTARTEPVRLSGINEFEKMGIARSERNDVAIDKKLWSGRTPTARDRPEYETLRIRCKECRKVCEVSENLIYVAEDTGKPQYTCDSCSASKR